MTWQQTLAQSKQGHSSAIAPSGAFVVDKHLTLVGFCGILYVQYSKLFQQRQSYILLLCPNKESYVRPSTLYPMLQRHRFTQTCVAWLYGMSQLRRAQRTRSVQATYYRADEQE